MLFQSDRNMSVVRAPEVAEILLRKWDPLDVGDNPKLSDEYDRYVPGVMRLLKSGAGIEEMERHLASIENSFGIEASAVRRQATAAQLVALLRDCD
jgi:hypothetical protein